jgi:secreted PhoX family phosphatase
VKDGSNTSTDQANAMGMHHDGMHFFPINGSSEDGLLAINFEYIDTAALHRPARPPMRTASARPKKCARKSTPTVPAWCACRKSTAAGRWSTTTR